MLDKIYLHLFILCGIWSQGLIEITANEKTRESSEILVRQKRVLSHVPHEDVSVPISMVPYVVRIRYYGRTNCVASILSNYVVITSAACALESPSVYEVSSGMGHLDRGTIHNVLDIRRHYANHPGRPRDGIALLTVNPHFVYGSTTYRIQLHSGPLLTGTLGTVSGWGYNYRRPDSGTRCTRSLRSIVVPIISHRDCVSRYRPTIEISDKDICTYHPQKHCGHNDGGAPLVVDGYLAGVHLWTGLRREQNNPEYPDVFAVLQDVEYNQWITTNVQNIEAQFQHHH